MFVIAEPGNRDRRIMRTLWPTRLKYLPSSNYGTVRAYISIKQREGGDTILCWSTYICTHAQTCTEPKTRLLPLVTQEEVEAEKSLHVQGQAELHKSSSQPWLYSKMLSKEIKNKK